MTEKIQNLILLKEIYNSLLTEIQSNLFTFKDNESYCYDSLLDTEDYIAKKSDELFLILNKAEIEI